MKLHTLYLPSLFVVLLLLLGTQVAAQETETATENLVENSDLVVVAAEEEHDVPAQHPQQQKQMQQVPVVGHHSFVRQSSPIPADERPVNVNLNKNEVGAILTESRDEPLPLSLLLVPTPVLVEDTDTDTDTPVGDAGSGVVDVVLSEKHHEQHEQPATDIVTESEPEPDQEDKAIPISAVEESLQLKLIKQTQEDDEEVDLYETAATSTPTTETIANAQFVQHDDDLGVDSDEKDADKDDSEANKQDQDDTALQRHQKQQHQDQAAELDVEQLKLLLQQHDAFASDGAEDDRTLLDIFGEVTKEYLTQNVVRFVDVLMGVDVITSSSWCGFVRGRVGYYFLVAHTVSYE